MADDTAGDATGGAVGGAGAGASGGAGAAASGGAGAGHGASDLDEPARAALARARAAFDEQTGALVGARVTGVHYADLALLDDDALPHGDAPDDDAPHDDAPDDDDAPHDDAPHDGALPGVGPPQGDDWDHGDWHHAVMGVGFDTDRGPRAILWSATFFAYGLEVYATPLADQLAPAPDGPVVRSVTEHPVWRARAGQTVLGVDTFWERLEVGPAVRASDGVVVEGARVHHVPVAFRLDFPAGPVWFVAAMPRSDGDDLAEAMVMADEVMVVLTADAMRTLGFPDCPFLVAGRRA